ncbi:MAG: bifunctional phosphoribosylaminoimidazolecarboxamide formyltransferase/IMP cyclohydrolase [Armatimonadota bacterium]|nr:bifunctional phosphoribosylaminoimidazolecarboxamide formyltransferase/IMP cyclohydrolase [Armatimonadota bacterium]MDW8026539.1 bifunctional phosphoribosylaminoimidazolecarboxamide formyltransferase/IMP cyclohydrolase [Armatimonadota bacterium]
MAKKVERALLSVSDKRGIVEFASGLHGLGIEIISTGGTAAAIRQAGIPVKDVSEVTGFPEMLDGRVKTLHPKIHGGILALRDNDEHVRQISEHGINFIDLVAVNLYPFAQTVSRPDVTLKEAIEQIDIGGPSLIRAAAKNYESVTVVVDPSDYDRVLHELRQNNCTTTEQLRMELAAKAFRHTAAYDAFIANYFNKLLGEPFPETLTISCQLSLKLRYGENPHQQAAFYVLPSMKHACISTARQIHGIPLSYNNIADLDAALELVREFEQPAAAIIKHTNPCGCAIGETLVEAFVKARDADPEARFGGIIAFNRVVDTATASEVIAKGSFYEAIIAPGYEDAAFEMIANRSGWGQSVRLLLLEGALEPVSALSDEVAFKSVMGGVLVQTIDALVEDRSQWRVVTERSPSDAEWVELEFAWKVVKHVKSNAIVLSRDGVTVGVGAGQMNRAISVKLAVEHAREKAKGAVLASEAFFPHPDGPEIAAKAGVTAIIQPGGSKRDEDVIAVCNKYGVAMVFTGTRHFRH